MYYFVYYFNNTYFFWFKPDEIRSGKVEYPYRFEFKVEYVLPKPSWIEDKVPVVGLKIGYQSGLNPVSKDSVKLLFEKIDPKWNTYFLRLITKEKIEKVEEKPKNGHGIKARVGSYLIFNLNNNNS